MAASSPTGRKRRLLIAAHGVSAVLGLTMGVPVFMRATSLPVVFSALIGVVTAIENSVRQALRRTGQAQET